MQAFIRSSSRHREQSAYARAGLVRRGGARPRAQRTRLVATEVRRRRVDPLPASRRDRTTQNTTQTRAGDNQYYHYQLGSVMHQYIMRHINKYILYAVKRFYIAYATLYSA